MKASESQKSSKIDARMKPNAQHKVARGEDNMMKGVYGHVAVESALKFS